MPAKVSIKNPEALTGVLDRLTEVASESVLRQAVVAGIQPLLAEARLRAPIGPYPHIRNYKLYRAGNLKANIIAFHDATKSAGGIRQTYGVTWSKDAFYGRFVEYGTSHSAAKPFLRPAFDATKKDVVRIIDEFIKAKAKELANGNG